MKKRRAKPGLSLNTRQLAAPSLSFKLTDTGTFINRGFAIGRHGIRASPLAAGDFSALTLDEIQPLEELGAGACGTVRLARHLPSGKLLALKVINVVADQSQRHQVLNELRLLIALEHAQLVPLFDAFYLEGYLYLALRYMDGGSLEQLLGSYQGLATQAGLAALGLPEAALSAVAAQVLCGLDPPP